MQTNPEFRLCYVQCTSDMCDKGKGRRKEEKLSHPDPVVVVCNFQKYVA